MNQNVPGLQILLELQISSLHFISGALLEEQQELFREFSNRAQQPLQKGQDVEKHLKSLPFPNPPQVTDMPITSSIS